MARNTIGQTFLVAFLLCVVCSVLVSGAAVILRPKQTANRILDKKENIIAASGLEQEGRSIAQVFEQIETRVVDLETGQYTDAVDPVTYDFVEATGNPQMSLSIPPKDDRAGIKRRAKYMPVYLVERRGEVERVILPIYGKGLWSTLYGFVTLDSSDMNTIRSLLFYQHGETPGLGGEVDNPAWKALWKGKEAFGEQGEVQIQVVRGTVDPTDPNAEHKVDGISGATITARGVQELLRYWLSDNGYGDYIKRMRAQAQEEA